MKDEPASPVCYAAQGDDVYMGYAGGAELAAALNVLLEAERAGARVTLESARAINDPAMIGLIKAVHADEAKWCGMLSAQLKRIGVTPSAHCGAFYGNAMAIADPHERLVFLNRGQAWVVRKLEELLPRVRDDILHAELKEMRVSHVENIRRTEQCIADTKG
ncbi:MAG: hypothetical protein EON93_05570 [Burkholderiales bacterium]|nr:MAG: hypothetical protein EON93_05570 [Burkholderiales bacterium]